MEQTIRGIKIPHIAVDKHTGAVAGAATLNNATGKIILSEGMAGAINRKQRQWRKKKPTNKAATILIVETNKAHLAGFPLITETGTCFLLFLFVWWRNRDTVGRVTRDNCERV